MATRNHMERKSFKNYQFFSLKINFFLFKSYYFKKMKIISNKNYIILD